MFINFGSVALDRAAHGADDLDADPAKLGQQLTAGTWKVDLPLADRAGGSAALEQDAVRDEQRLVDVMGDEDRGRPVGGHDAQQQRLHVGARHLVQRAEGLVQQQDLGLPCKTARKGGALCHATR